MKEPVKVRVATEVMEQWAARDESGRKLEWDWGEPDAEGFHAPTVTVVGAEGAWFTVDSLAMALYHVIGDVQYDPTNIAGLIIQAAKEAECERLRLALDEPADDRDRHGNTIRDDVRPNASSRPWVAEWRSNMHGWNERDASRFATEAAAKRRAKEMEDDGCWDVRVVYAPVKTRLIQAAKEAEHE